MKAYFRQITFLWINNFIPFAADVKGPYLIVCMRWNLIKVCSTDYNVFVRSRHACAKDQYA